ncbi:MULTISPECIES: hypothetical protein [unclassified Pseudoclavibacter]|uniref:hypothetical protein n=1 Tax=unclassified Pseudoclavibacter TaxID=2615177 RepID=UPI001BA7B70B|nr:hypothetical protein [Pseudoclavibacter sp. Marseille-Q4354]MBS3178686.1 hypothetical protein [Pseudoclavibacter sp. Marseille-Q4354]
MSIVLTVNREQFVLHDPESISRLHGDIRDAVQAGGSLVPIGSRSDSPEVLITPATHVRIDVLDVSEEVRGTDSGDVVFIDFDQY